MYFKEDIEKAVQTTLKSERPFTMVIGEILTPYI
jgi:hypothetical protein